MLRRTVCQIGIVVGFIVGGLDWLRNISLPRNHQRQQERIVWTKWLRRSSIKILSGGGRAIATNSDSRGRRDKLTAKTAQTSRLHSPLQRWCKRVRCKRVILLPSGPFKDLVFSRGFGPHKMLWRHRCEVRMKTEIANHLSHPRVEATGSLSSGICKGLPLDYRLSVVHSAPYIWYLFP